MSENKPVIIPTTYHNFDAIASVLLRRIKNLGDEDALAYADELTYVSYGPDLPFDQACLDVQRENRRTLYNGLKATGAMSEEFMQSAANLFGIKEETKAAVSSTPVVDSSLVYAI